MPRETTEAIIVDSGVVHRESRHGSVGRPELTYRWIGETDTR